MSRQKKARVAAQANSKSQHYSSKPTVSRYRQKQYERTAMGVAMLSALRGGQ